MKSRWTLSALIIFACYIPRAGADVMQPIAVNPGVSTRPTAGAEMEPTLKVTRGDPPSDDLLKQTVTGINAAVAKLQWLSIDATTTHETYDLQTRTWEDAGSIVGTALLEIGGSRRARFDIQEQRIPWSNGAAPFVVERYVETWNGREARRLYEDAAQVCADRILQGEAVSGHWGTMSLLWMDQADAAGQVVTHHEFSPEVMAHYAYSSRQVILNNHQAAVEIVRTEPGGAEHRRTYFVDPSHGFALLGRIETAGDHVRDETVVYSLTEAAPGVFCPQSIATRQFSNNTVTLSVFKATDVRANQVPGPGAFTVPFPAAIRVQRRPSAAEVAASRPGK